MECVLNDINIKNSVIQPGCAEAHNAADNLCQKVNAIGPVTIRKAEPSLAWTAVQLGLAKENAGKNKLQDLTSGVKARLKHIDSLLDLHAELIALPEKDSHDISDKVQGMIKELRSRGIEVWPNGGNKVSKEKLGEMKSHISSQIDKLHGCIRTTMTTEIQPEVHAIQTIMSMIQQMIQSNNRLNKHISDHSTK